MKKVCGLCGEDLTDKPRTKDPKGRYFCVECYEGLVARKHARHEDDSTANLPAAPPAKAPAASPAPTPASPAAAAALNPAPKISEVDIPLADEDSP